MKIAPLHPKESERLEKLKEFKILDTAVEACYEDITRLASLICQTPICAISLVDRERQWFKSIVGLDARETSRDVAFCSHTILQTDPMIVEDALKDSRFSDNPLVSGAPGIRFYAGIPLVLGNQLPLGALCVIDQKPRELTSEQLSALQALARQTLYLFDARLKNAQLIQREQMLEDQRSKLVSQAKMAALGEMASGVAHEINNPLAIIVGRTQQLRDLLVQAAAQQAPGPQNWEKMVDAIEKTSFRISKIIAGLRAFSRNGDLEAPLPMPLDSVVNDSLNLCRERIIRSGVRLHVGSLPVTKIQCRSVQISQVLLNLLNNAFDAIQSVQDRWIRLDVEETPEQVLIRVIDSGNRIPDSVAEKLLQPFFTTKPVGQGTGLGLSIAAGIVQSHGGKLWLDRAHPHTCFVVELPKPANSELTQASRAA